MLTIPTFGALLLQQPVRMVRVRVGDTTPAFSGKVRTNTRGRYRQWSVTTSFYTYANAESIVAALAGTPPLACSGTLLGGSVNCHLVGEPTVNYLSADTATVQFTLRETVPT